MSTSKKTNRYDKILKENFILELLDVFKVMLGIEDCEITSDTTLPQGKLHTTIEREPDFVRVMKRTDGERFVLHIEFQATGDSNMLQRMQEYHALIQRKVNLPIRHFVIYLGKKKPAMKTSMEENKVFSGFELKNIYDYQYERLLQSEVPEEILMAVLANFGNEASDEVISRIIKRLMESAQDQIKLKKYIYQLTVLSKLRNLEEKIVKQTEHMALTIDLKDSILYKRAIQQGKEEGKLEVVRNLITQGFDDPTIARATGLSEQQIQELRNLSA